MRITLFTSDEGFKRMLANAGFMGVKGQNFYFRNKFTVDIRDIEQCEDDEDMYWIEKSESVEYLLN